MTRRREYSRQGDSINKRNRWQAPVKSSYSGELACAAGWRRQRWVHAVGGEWAALCHAAAPPIPRLLKLRRLAPWSLGLETLSMTVMTALWSQMRGTMYHKGLFFMSYWAPSNSCMLFIPHTLFSSLLMKSPMPQPSASRRQAVPWTVLFDIDSAASDVTYGLYHEILLNSLFPHITYHWIICSHHRTSVCISRSVFRHGHGLYLST